MATFQEIMGEPLPDEGSVPPAATDGPFSQGLRSGFTTLQSNLHALAGGVAAPFSDDFAANEYARSRELADQAAREAPQVGSISDIHDLRSGFDYLAGKAGEVLPVGAGMLGATLLTRGRAPFLASTAALAPSEIGSALHEQDMDPVARKAEPLTRLKNAAIAGGASAAIQSVVPAAMEGKLVAPAVTEAVKGPFLKRLATNVAGASAGNAAAGAGADLVQQAGVGDLNPDRPLDLARTGESAAAGAVLGAPFGALGTAGEAVHGGTPGTPGRTPIATPILDAAKARFNGLFNRGETQDTRVAQAIAADRPVEPMPAGADPQAFMADNDAKVTTWVADKLKGLLDDPHVPDDLRERAAALIDKVADPAAQTEAATVVLAKQAIDKADAFREHVAQRVGESDVGGKMKQALDQVRPKQSEDYVGTRAVIAQEIMPILQKTSPEVLQSDVALAHVSDAIRMVLKSMQKGEPLDETTTNMMHAFLGDDAVPVLHRLASVMSDDTTALENSAKSLSLLHDSYQGDASLYRAVADNLANKQGVTKADVREAVKVLKSYTNGSYVEGLTPANAKLHEQMLRAELEKTFGANTEKVLNEFQKAHESTKAKAVADTDKTAPESDDADIEAAREAAAQGEADTHGLETQDRETTYEPPRYYPEDKLILKHEIHRAKYGNEESQARRMMAKAKAENPDRAVSFMPAEDYARFNGISPEKLNEITNGHPEHYGAVAAEGVKQEARLTPKQAREMLLQSKDWARSKSRIDTDKTGVTLDAYKITSKTMEHLPRISKDETMPHYVARAFAEGLGSALVHFDAKVGDLPDSLVIAKMHGQTITLGDIRASKIKSPFIRATDLESDMMDAKRQLNAARRVGDKALASKYKDRVEELRRKEYGRAMNEGKTKTSDLERVHQDLGLTEIPKDDEIHLAAMEHGETSDLRVGHSRDETAPSTRKTAGAEAKPAEPAEHIPARAHDVQDDAKQLVSGGADFESIIEHYARGVPEAREGMTEVGGKTVEYPVGTSYKSGTSKAEPPSPVKIRSLINAINETKIKNKRELRNANEAVDRLNRALAETLKKSPDAAYDLQLKKTEARATGDKEATDKSRQHVEKYIKDVLGDKVNVLWRNLMHAGEFEYEKKEGLDPTYTIRLSVHALDPMGSAFHESAHAFFAMLRDKGMQKVMKPLYRAANTAPVMNQLRTLLKDSPEALRQIERDQEERVAYMYQFYTRGKLKLGTASENVLGRIKDFVLKTLGIWTNDERATRIMEYFHEGEFARNMDDRNAVYKALIDDGRNRAVEYAKSLMQPLKNIENAILTTGADRLRNTEIPALMKIADTIQPAHAGSAAHDIGWIQSSANERVARLNGWIRDMKGLSEDDLDRAHDVLKRGITATGDAKVDQAIKATRMLLDNMYEYMRKAGVNVGDLGVGKDYFPRVWDADFISRHQDEFKKMIERYVVQGKLRGDPEKIMQTIMARDGVEMQGIVADLPGMQHTKTRFFKMISDLDAAPFLQKNMMATISSYVMQATRRAEWARRFGNDGSGVDMLLKEARRDGATDEEIDTARNFLLGVDGTLGDKINPTARRWIGNMIVYQNIRLLPLAIFSSLIDPGGIMVRGGTMGDAFKAFKRGIAEIPRGFKKATNNDEWHQLAQDMGTIDDTALVHALGSSYTQGMVSETAKKINDTFFKWNLMEQFNTSMRVSATEAAMKFIAKHGDGTFNKHSVRWLEELGLKPGDVIVKDGRPLVRMQDFLDHGMSIEEATGRSNQMRGAINRWVDGAVLRPNAADKPIWMNDPHYALFAHLKQFTYAFHHTILKRVWNEAQYGNYGPAMALASYVPMMIASDYVKGLIQGGGQQPDWKKGWDAGDYLYSGSERAGLFGVSQFSSDFYKGIRQGGAGIDRVLGPTWEQLTEGIKTIAGREMFKTAVMHSLPANALYAHAIGAPATDPNFAE